MNEGVLREVLDKFEHMEKVPQSIMNELARAIQRADELKEEKAILIDRNIKLCQALDKMMSLYSELRERCGLDGDLSDLKYDIYSELGLMDDPDLV
jgi:hypothetical protein